MRILAGDIGGTNTRLCVWDMWSLSLDATPRLVVAALKFRNSEYDSLEAILEASAGSIGTVTHACFGVAGPVTGRTVRLTNIPRWPPLDPDHVAGQLGVPPERVSLINDMAAHGCSIDLVERHFTGDVVTLRAGQADAAGPRAIVMPGTGLGIGALRWDEHDRCYHPIATEGGHVDFAPRTDEQDAVLRSMRRLNARAGRTTVTREDVLSGPGLRAVYACLKNPTHPDLDDAPAAEVIVSLAATDVLARQTLDLFVQALAATCAGVAFSHLCTGGLWVAGSIARSLLQRLRTSEFLNVFDESGPPSLRGLAAAIPLKVLSYAETGLLGAAAYTVCAGR